MSWQYVRWVREQVRGVTAADKALLYTIADATPQGQAGAGVQLFQRDLSEQSGLPERSLRDSLARLRAAGLVETSGKGGHVRGRGMACTYRLNVPETDDEKPAGAAGLVFITRREPPCYQENRREPPRLPGGSRLQEPGGSRRQYKERLPLREEREGGEKTDDVTAAVDAWNSMAARAGLPQAMKTTDARRRTIAARLKDLDGLDGWRALLAKVEESEFLTGRVPGQGGRDPFRATLDWVAKDSNTTRIMEGNYGVSHGRNHATGAEATGTQRQGRRASIAGIVARDRVCRG